jgi:C4-dicarboxylate-specific signal transduction histidine kinase
MLEQVIINLLKNALDAVSTSSFKTIKFDTSVNEKFVQIKITDNSRGIAPMIWIRSLFHSSQHIKVGQVSASRSHAKSCTGMEVQLKLDRPKMSGLPLRS